jgi:hypothetical protein
MRRWSLMVCCALVVFSATAARGSAQQGGMMGMHHDSTAMAHMPAIHTLLWNHERIVRTVTDLPDGIRTLTESDDPALVLRIREHVTGMYRVLASGVDPGLPHTTPALRTILRDRDRISTRVDTTAKGILVVQTSSDAATVSALQQHAREVTEMVRSGREAFHGGMMQRGGMMHRGPPDSSFGAMQARGRMVMGVDQYTSSHRFDSLEDGGRIEFVRNTDDSAGVAVIRAHLQEIAGAFASGDFRAPAAVHLQRVPGGDVMAARREAIRYSYRELPRGGEVRMVTKDPAALRAIHEFLEFQRREHRTPAAEGHKHPR